MGFVSSLNYKEEIIKRLLSLIVGQEGIYYSDIEDTYYQSYIKKTNSSHLNAMNDMDAHLVYLYQEHYVRVIIDPKTITSSGICNPNTQFFITFKGLWKLHILKHEFTNDF